MNHKNILFGSLTVSWLGTLANFAAEAKSILGAMAALASVVASCYAIAASRKRLRANSTAARARLALNSRRDIKRKVRQAPRKRNRLLTGSVMVALFFAGLACL